MLFLLVIVDLTHPLQNYSQLAVSAIYYTAVRHHQDTREKRETVVEPLVCCECSTTTLHGVYVHVGFTFILIRGSFVLCLYSETRCVLLRFIES